MDTITDIISRTGTETDWLFAIDAGESCEDFVEANQLAKDRLAELCESYGVSEDFLFELIAISATFREAIHADLADIWKRLDRLER